MTNIRDPDDKDLAKQDYLYGMKYKDLAEKYEVSINTIKSWIKRYGWSKEKNKKVHTKRRRVHP
ncbi:Sigma-70, region 4 [Desulfonispora thiosulfatigenes DSM 11270]|uniref:Sigma-70, region 4 n=1 Tax=Desulfonispora thiosulfatigenes DSM 11270 TaxID=656914 RepID=A0A1W1VQ09_DESTI|nr:Sigma-70, region 4 [Desulfonispora thiosulfatigenes DSM 11270]